MMKLNIFLVQLSATIYQHPMGKILMSTLHKHYDILYTCAYHMICIAAIHMISWSAFQNRIMIFCIVLYYIIDRCDTTTYKLISKKNHFSRISVFEVNGKPYKGASKPTCSSCLASIAKAPQSVLFCPTHHCSALIRTFRCRCPGWPTQHPVTLSMKKNK